MPKQVLVALGVVYGAGLMLFAAPAICAGPSEAMTGDNHHTEKTAATFLTLEEALHRGLNNNPEITAYASEVRARDHEVDQAGLYPNPELSLEMENFSGSGAFSGTGNAETTALLSQKIELGGERRQRIAVSELDRGIAEQALDGARSELFAKTRRLFTEVLASQQRLALAGEQTTLAAKVLAAVNDRIRAGKAPEIERLRFESLLLETELLQNRARQELEAAKKALAALWSSEKPDFDRVQGDFQTLRDIPDWSELAALIDTSPEIALQKKETVRAGTAVALEKAKRIPDLTLDIGAKSFEETGDHALVAGISIDVPLFDRNQGSLGAARARQEKARSSLNATRMQLRTELGNLWQRLQVARTEAIMLREKILPKARQRFETTSYGYRAGKFGYIDVLDAERALFAMRSRYIDSLKTFHQTFADLEALLGRDFRTINIDGRLTAVQ